MDGVDERLVTVGAGFAGLGLAVRLQQAGVEDFTILDRASEIGGTWRQHLSRLRLRRPLAPVLVLVRAQPGLVARLRPPRCARACARSSTSCSRASAW